MTVAILGGGLSALSFAHFSGVRCVVFEKEDRLGGLCRSFDFEGVPCDIGPHIFFSRNEEALDPLRSWGRMRRLRRANRVLYKGRLVKYPFENELSALPEEDRDFCLDGFLHNPYARYEVDHFLGFLYKTFGEGITRCYLEPYNRKIWKYEPSLMDLQMADRIPKPRPEDIAASARGESTEGYLHQLYFWYPREGGAEEVIRGLSGRCCNVEEVHLGSPIERLRVLRDGGFEVAAGGRTRHFPRVVSTIPLHELLPVIDPAPPEDVKRALAGLIYNSIHITLVNAVQDNCGNVYAITVPDPGISFHRLSKVGFLGASYQAPDLTTIMAEITYRKGSMWDLPGDLVTARVVEDLDRLGLVASRDVRSAQSRSFPYAYVIYDRAHRSNTDKVLSWLHNMNITSIGRFGAFEYINTDDAVVRAADAARRFLSGSRSEAK